MQEGFCWPSFEVGVALWGCRDCPRFVGLDVVQSSYVGWNPASSSEQLYSYVVLGGIPPPGPQLVVGQIGWLMNVNYGVSERPAVSRTTSRQASFKTISLLAIDGIHLLLSQDISSSHTPPVSSSHRTLRAAYQYPSCPCKIGDCAVLCPSVGRTTSRYRGWMSTYRFGEP